MDRRHFIRVIGGGSIIAATMVSQPGCSAISSSLPPAAVEAGKVRLPGTPTLADAHWLMPSPRLTRITCSPGL